MSNGVAVMSIAITLRLDTAVTRATSSICFSVKVMLTASWDSAAPVKSVPRTMTTVSAAAAAATAAGIPVPSSDLCRNRISERNARQQYNEYVK